jgi:Protein of unknown function (DUF3164)
MTSESMFTPAFIADPIIQIAGEPHMVDGKGAKVPAGLVKAQDKLQDELVRKVMGYGIALSAQVARFKAHTFDDIGAFAALLEQEYGAKLGGAKGNMTLMSFDGLMKVTVQVADYIDFGPELMTAKSLIDECLNEWASGARDEVRAIITRAFNTDKPGQINRSEIFMLLRLEIADPRWQRAMQAIRDAMRVVGSKSYVRLYRRDTQDGQWQAVTIDLARG